MKSLKYSVQLITNSDQLTEALSLRYKVYKKAYPKCTEKFNRPFESDDFDSRSIHLGLFYEEGEVKKMAGYCRLILPSYFKNKFSNLLINDHPEYIQDAGIPSNERMALIGRMDNPEYSYSLNSFCSSLEAKEAIYIESSRFIIEEEHRSLSLSTFFVASMFAVCESLNIKYTFFTCTHHHLPFYERFGLTLFPGISAYDNSIFGEQFIVFGTDMNLASPKEIIIKSLRLQLEAEKQMTYKKAA